MKRYRFSFSMLAALLLGCAATLNAAQSVTLSWDRNAEPNVSGYRLLYGTDSAALSQSVDVQDTTAVVTNLAEGATYYFAVTAYDTAGAESLPSDEVSYTVPQGPNPTPAPTATPGSSPSATPGSTPSATPRASATPSASPATAQTNLLNVSTRAFVQNGDKVLIGGLIVSGNTSKNVVIRALGPSLASANLTNVLQDPAMSLYDSSGTVIASNDNWRSNATAVQASGLAPKNDLEAVIVARLAPGSYTVVISGSNGSTGVGLLEFYDLQPTGAAIRNLSTRGKVEVNDNAMIGGFILGGTQATQVVIRAVGPSLAAAGVNEALQDPVLELYNGSGTLIYTNDNWRSTQSQQLTASGLAPSDDREAAITATLPPGSYTSIVRGNNGATGVALVEVYNLP